MKNIIIVAAFVTLNLNVMANNNPSQNVIQEKSIPFYVQDMGQYIDGVNATGYSYKNGYWQEIRQYETLYIYLRNGSYYAHRLGEANEKYLRPVYRSDRSGYKYYIEYSGYGSLVRWYFNSSKMR